MRKASAFCSLYALLHAYNKNASLSSWGAVFPFRDPSSRQGDWQHNIAVLLDSKCGSPLLGSAGALKTSG